jgi:hypothetical protein
LVTFVWLLISLLIISEPSPNLMFFVLEFYAVLGLVGVWLVLLAPGAYRAVRAAGWKGLLFSSGYLLPLPVAAALLISAAIYQLPLRARLELGEGPLADYAERVEAGDEDADAYHILRFIGVFQVHQAYKRDGCVIFVTDSFGPDDEGGLAYCSGTLPCGPTVEMDHIKGNWWTWNYWQTNERC